MKRSRVASVARRCARIGTSGVDRARLPLGVDRLPLRVAGLDADHRAGEVDVAPRQIAQFAQPRAGVERRREERAVELALGRGELVDLVRVALGLRPLVLLTEHSPVDGLELDRLENVEDARVLERDALGVLGRVARDQLAPLGELEDAVQQHEDLLRRPRREVRSEQLAPVGVDVLGRERSRRSSRTSTNCRPLAAHDDLMALGRVQRRVAAEPRQKVAPATLRASRSVLCLRRFSTSRYSSHASTASPNVGTVLRRPVGSIGVVRDRRAGLVEQLLERGLRHLRGQEAREGTAPSSTPDHRAARGPLAAVLHVRAAELRRLPPPSWSVQLAR